MSEVLGWSPADQSGMERPLMQSDVPLVFRSDNLAVRAHLGRGSRVCFVTFDPMSDDLSLDRPAFAEAYLAGLGIDSIHILSANNLWYQDADLPAVLDQVRDLVTGYDNVVAYGSSMGGYAALRFGARAGAKTAIAISPQYSVIDARVPHETRWRELRESVQWLHEHPGDTLPAFDDAVIFCDDRESDGRHAMLIAAEIPTARIVSLPYAGHPAGTFLAETGVLSSAILDAAYRRIDLEALYRTVRQRRRRSGHYLYTLARRQPLCRMRTKLGLMELALAAQPFEPVYLSYSALVLEAAGQGVAALERHERATANPLFGLAHIRRGRCLWRAGLRADGMGAIAQARVGLPRSVGPIEIGALMLALDRRAADAMTLLFRFDERRPASVIPAARQRWIDVAAKYPAISGGIGRVVGFYLTRRTKLLQRSARDELTEADRE